MPLQIILCITIVELSRISSCLETGSKATLSLPDIRERAIAFHAMYYTASNMQLVILSSYEYEDLKQHVEALFSCMEPRAPVAHVIDVRSDRGLLRPRCSLRKCWARSTEWCPSGR